MNNIIDKICSCCHINKSIENFGIDKYAKIGYSSQCKQCKKQKYRKKFQPNFSITDKRCFKCGEIKSIENFFINRIKKDGYNNRCKSCSYKETLNERFSKWKWHAKNRNIPFNLQLKDLENIPQKCYYTGIPLTLKQNCDNTISLDRLNNEMGYDKNNVVFCCGYINYMKNDLSYNQFISTCKQITDYLKV